jgi:thiamine-monophosphate kinase
MKIDEIGGEFALISRIHRILGDSKNPDVLVGIGDDAAVLKYRDERHLLFTTDTLVEKDHFNPEWSTPFQIGMKAVEINVSDIAAMGGLPTHALVSLVLRKETECEFIEEMYRGMLHSSRKHGCHIIGGNVTHGSEIVINIAMLGEVEKNRLCLRSNAKPGQLILVTGDLGKSASGLEILLKNLNGHTQDHLEPKSHLKEARTLSRFTNCMIDVSDGLAPEVKHICEMSRTGAVIFKDNIPLSKATKQNAEILGKDPADFALYGGEDFELVFTLPENKIPLLKKELENITVVGKVLPGREGIYLLDEKGNKKQLGTGYDHFL